MPVAGASSFSAGLQFSRKALQPSSGSAEHDNKRAHDALSSLPLPPPLTEEEELLRTASELRQGTADALQPRLDALEAAFRVLQRSVAALRPHLPSAAFLTFHHSCVAQRRQLCLREAATVQSLVKKAVEASVAAGCCDAVDAARWRKSNRRPLLTTFVDLQLLVTMTTSKREGSPSVQEAASVRDLASASPSAAAALAVDDAVDASVHRQISVSWAAHRCNDLDDTFLHRFFLLKDILHGWGAGWRPLPSCSAGEEEKQKGRGEGGLVTCTEDHALACPWPSWTQLSSLDKLCSFSALCPKHLTEPVVDTLESSLRSELSVVWEVLGATI